MQEKEIVEILCTIKEPESGQDIITKNMVKDLKVDGKNINLTIILPSLKYAHKSTLSFDIMGAIMEKFPAANPNVHFAVPSSKQEKLKTALPQVKNIIAVASGKGGVGKSTVAVNLALGLKEMGARVGLIDADIWGPSIPTMFGMQKAKPKLVTHLGKPHIIPLQAHGIHLMSIGFVIAPEQAVVLRGPRLGGIVRQFIHETIWPELDYIVIDLPPGTGDVQLTLVQTIPITGAVMVTTPQEVAIADAIKAMNMFLLDNVNVPILGVVENMSWFTPKELPNNKYFLFGEGGGKRLAKMSRSMLLGQIPIVQGIREAGDNGTPAILQTDSIVKNAFMNVTQNTLRQVAMRNEMLPPTQIVGVK